MLTLRIDGGNQTWQGHEAFVGNFLQSHPEGIL
jgi:hypothetical protein